MTEKDRNDGEPKEFEHSSNEDDSRFSADQLSQAFAQLMEEVESDSEHDLESDDDETASSETEKQHDKADIVVSPTSILEAMLFVGHPENQPLTNRQLASSMRGVSPDEIDDLVVELNKNYEIEETAYKVASDGNGYSLQLRSEFEPVRNLFYGRVREAKLSQSAIDLLAIVAYQQPIDRKQIDQLVGKPCGGILNQLVRREMLAVEKTTEKPARTLYRTTDRFLDFFKLESVEDLPSVDDL